MDNKRQHGGGTLNTFFFGVLIGVMLSLLFTTKKGRKLLKVITDEGAARLSHWEDTLSSMEQHLEDDLIDEEESVVGESREQEVRGIESPKTIKLVDKENDEEPLHSEKPDKKEEVTDEKSSPKKSKRLFRGIRRSKS